MGAGGWLPVNFECNILGHVYLYVLSFSAKPSWCMLLTPSDQVYVWQENTGCSLPEQQAKGHLK